MQRLQTIASCAALAAALALPGGADAADRFHLLYTFRGADGAFSIAAPIVDASGNLYGTTSSGGPANKGTVFKLAPDGNQTLLAGFDRNHSGIEPTSSLWRDANGNLFGTTFRTARRSPFGTVFEITQDGREKVLHRFSGGDAAGYGPWGGVTGDASGNLYGTTSQGGALRGGTIFKLAPDGTMTVVHAFDTNRNSGDASAPWGSLAMDAGGNLYGTSQRGGAAGGGALFKVAPDGTESIVYSFGSERGDGTPPNGGVLIDAAGNFYATTTSGGFYGYGTIYRIAPDRSAVLLHSFSRYPDGGQPNGGLVADAKGNLYGTTYQGGNTNNCGTVFELSPGGRFRVLHTFDEIFRRIRNGIEPQAGLAIDAAGNLYGTTSRAGGNGRHTGDGTVFKIDAQ